MARIIYSALVQSINGSIQGTTFQRNAYGNTVKAKPSMVKPARFKQQNRKNTFSQASQAWKGLTQAQRDQWITYATTYPRPSRLNPNSYLNGFNYFVMANQFYRLYAIGGIIAAPTGAQGAVTSFNIELVRTGIFLQIEITDVTVGSNWNALIYLTRPLGDGQEAVQPTPIYMRQVVLFGISGGSVQNEYFEQFGILPNVGDWLGLRVVLQKSDNGQVLELPITQIQIT
jgi:hypothetical protein